MSTVRIHLLSPEPPRPFQQLTGRRAVVATHRWPASLPHPLPPCRASRGGPRQTAACRRAALAPPSGRRSAGSRGRRRAEERDSQSTWQQHSIAQTRHDAYKWKDRKDATLQLPLALCLRPHPPPPAPHRHADPPSRRQAVTV